MKAYITLIVLFALTITSCMEEKDLSAIPPSGNMVISMESLPVLDNDYRYEGWILSGTTYSSVGKFLVDDAGMLDDLAIPVESSRLESATEFMVTLQMATDTDETPTGPVLLKGSFTQYEALLSADDDEAWGSDASDENNYTGNYLINAPTTSTADDDTSGIWFIDNSSGSAQAGLNIPALSSGWVYEGWTIIDGTLVSTGTFSDPGAADNSCDFCGPNAAPSYPGEDFIQNAPNGLSFPTNLAEAGIRLSIEPSTDNDPDNPFYITGLRGTVPPVDEIIIGQSYSMEFDATAAPTGKVLRFYGFDCTDERCF